MFLRRMLQPPLPTAVVFVSPVEEVCRLHRYIRVFATNFCHDLAWRHLFVSRRDFEVLPDVSLGHIQCLLDGVHEYGAIRPVGFFLFTQGITSKRRSAPKLLMVLHWFLSAIFG